jgi:selenocysteine-specific elongation factor
MVEKVSVSCKTKGQVSLAEVRDLFGTSRKYAQALLEYLDSIGITIRIGDFRKLKSSDGRNSR